MCVCVWGCCVFIHPHSLAHSVIIPTLRCLCHTFHIYIPYESGKSFKSLVLFYWCDFAWDKYSLGQKTGKQIKLYHYISVERNVNAATGLTVQASFGNGCVPIYTNTHSGCTVWKWASVNNVSTWSAAPVRLLNSVGLRFVVPEREERDRPRCMLQAHQGQLNL